MNFIKQSEDGVLGWLPAFLSDGRKGGSAPDAPPLVGWQKRCALGELGHQMALLIGLTALHQITGFDE